MASRKSINANKKGQAAPAAPGNNVQRGQRLAATRVVSGGYNSARQQLSDETALLSQPQCSGGTVGYCGDNVRREQSVCQGDKAQKGQSAHYGSNNQGLSAYRESNSQNGQWSYHGDSTQNAQPAYHSSSFQKGHSVSHGGNSRNKQLACYGDNIHTTRGIVSQPSTDVFAFTGQQAADASSSSFAEGMPLVGCTLNGDLQAAVEGLDDAVRKRKITRSGSSGGSSLNSSSSGSDLIRPEPLTNYLYCAPIISVLRRSSVRTLVIFGCCVSSRTREVPRM
ncbi:unnamed protein product [Gongylonema pulchrum]|uniref:ZM domain-containing protein n=1 Tax=Gongylonema pulchrum TaxID=637853 RepID=A0A183DSR5_9BILA|nr:unnamed protein product [Gongylonema pulchrum]